MNKMATIKRDDIHPEWCTCSDCCLDRKRGFRLDLLVIGFGLAAALFVVATLQLQAVVAMVDWAL